MCVGDAHPYIHLICKLASLRGTKTRQLPANEMETIMLSSNGWCCMGKMTRRRGTVAEEPSV